MDRATSGQTGCAWSFSLDGIPALSQIRFFGLEDLAQLFDAFFHLCGVAISNFNYERGSAAQVQWHQRLQQVIAIDGAVAEGRRRLVDHVNPKLVGNVKALPITMDVTGQVDKRLGRKKKAIDLAQIGNTLLGSVDHAVGVDGERFDSHLEWKA